MPLSGALVYDTGTESLASKNRQYLESIGRRPFHKRSFHSATHHLDWFI